MSIESYLLAVRNRLRTHLNISGAQPEAICEICPDGRPNPIAGQEFWAVHPSPNLATNSTSQTTYLDERCDISITYTRRTGVLPYDRLGANAITSPETSPGAGIPVLGLLATARAAAVYIARQDVAYDTMNEANGILGEETTGFVEPMRLQSLSYLGVKGGEWFVGVDAGHGDEATGMAVEIRLGGARRVQPTDESMT